MQRTRIHAPSCGAAVWLLAAAGAAASADEGMRSPAATPPPILATLDLDEPLQALALRPDGRAAALALPRPDNDRHSIVRFHALDAAAPREAVVPATVRDLVFAPDGAIVFGISARGGKRGITDTYLFTFEPESGKVREHNRLPPTARDLAVWADRKALLIVAVDEVRTIRFDGLRSGPLYRVAGASRSIASIGAARVLIGQDDALLLLDLDDPPGTESMPVRERLPMPVPVLHLAAAGNDGSVVARDAAGRLYDVTVDPLRARAIEAETSGTLVAVVTTAPPPGDPATPQPAGASGATPAEHATGHAGTVPAAATAAAVTGPPAETSPAAETPTAVPAAGQSAPAPAPGVEAETPAPPPPAGDTAPAGAATAVPAATPSPRYGAPSPHAVAWGRLAGQAAAAVTAVVLFGPNNLLAEAARVTPHDGIWEVATLAPGRYRVQMDAGGDRVLVTRPGFLVVEVGAAGSVEAPDCEVVSVVEPASRE